MRNRVYLTKIASHQIEQALSRLCDKLPFPAKANKIGIKVNLCDYRMRETGVTTDPLVLDPLLKILRSKYPESTIYLIEHDATSTIASNLFKWLDIDKTAARYDAACVSLADHDWEKVKIDGYRFKEIDVSRTILDCDLMINHPKLKTHGRTKVTCGLKNMFGCYRIKNKVAYHRFLDEAIVDINLAVKSHITIVDGYLCVEGNRGPTQGLPKKTGVFIGGEDIVAVDACCAKVMGFNPNFITHIRLAQKKGLGSMRYDLESELDKDQLRELKFKFNFGKYALMEALRKVLK